MIKVKLRKVKTLLNHPHPNGVEVGFNYYGFIQELPKVGEPLYFIGPFQTSVVTKVSKVIPAVGGTHMFETRNSVYYLTFL